MKYIIAVLSLLLMTSCVAAIEISEVMYNPEGTDTNREWVEVYTHAETNTENISFFDNEGNHHLTLIQGTYNLQNYAIITNNAASFIQEHNYSGILFQASFSLSNTGESLGLKQNSEVLDNVTYSNNDGANGNGMSLERTASGWQESTTIGGTPGYSQAQEVPEFTGIAAAFALLGVLVFFFKKRA